MEFRYTLKDKNNQVIKDITIESWDYYLDDFVESVYEDGEYGFLDDDIDEAQEVAMDNLQEHIESDGEYQGSYFIQPQSGDIDNGGWLDEEDYDLIVENEKLEDFLKYLKDNKMEFIIEELNELPKEDIQVQEEELDDY